MDEILATLPAVERTLVEADLEAEATGGGATPEPSFFDKGKARADRLSMSWEEVKGPSTANGSAAHTKNAPKDLPQFGASPIVPISARNDMPRFGGSASRPLDPVSGNTFVPIPTSTSAPSQVHSQTQQSPFIARSNHLLPLSSSQNSRTPAPLLGSSGIRYPAPLFTQPTASATKSSSSLFTLAGSANQTRNAFYTPPVTNGVKRPLGDDESRPMTEAPPAPNVGDEPPAPTNGDVNMESDDDYAASTRVTNAQRTQETVDTAPAELSYSVFGNSSKATQPPFKSRRITRAETEVKMPPGAYVPDEEELADRHQRHTSLSPPPPPPVKQTRSSRSRAHKLEHGPNLKHSLPGAFVSEDDNEEEDYVAPLPASPPPSKRPTRKGRSTRSVEPEDETSQPPARPTRRSTRLTAASSVASTSPEPPSPRKAAVKAKKSTRTAGSTGSKSGSRKK